MSCHCASRSERADGSNRSWKWLGWLLYFLSLLDEDWLPLHINQHMNGDHFHCVSSEDVLWRTECGEEGSKRKKKGFGCFSFFKKTTTTACILAPQKQIYFAKLKTICSVRLARLRAVLLAGSPNRATAGSWRWVRDDPQSRYRLRGTAEGGLLCCGLKV